MTMSMSTSVGYLAARERRAPGTFARPLAAPAWRTPTPLFSGIQGAAVSNHSLRPTGDSARTGNLVV